MEKVKGESSDNLEIHEEMLGWQGLSSIDKEKIKNNGPVLMEKEEREKKCENMYLGAGD